MSLANFEELKKEVIAWSHREDTGIRVETFIQLAETQMLSNPVEPLQLRGNETLAPFSTSITTRFVALPDGFLFARKIRIQIVNGQSHELRFVPPINLQVRDHAGLPTFYTVTDQIEFDRISDIIYTGEIQYTKEFTPLSDDNPVNNVLTDHPDIYLFGTLAALFKHAQDEEQAASYYGQFIQSIKASNDKDNLGRYGPAPVMRIEGSVP